MRYFLSTLALTALASSCVTALGTNCNGDERCDIGGTPGKPREEATKLNDQLGEIDDDSTYKNGYPITCIRGGHGSQEMCARLQNVEGNKRVSGRRIKELGNSILENGCRVCGSAPVFDDDVSKGQLTFQYT